MSIVVALAVSPLEAARPVSASGLPGGALVVDSDGGSGESWGRVGGRTLQLSGINAGLFDALSWGVVSGTVPGIAFAPAARRRASTSCATSPSVTPAS